MARTLNTRPGPKLKRSSRAFRYKEQSENPGVTEITEILNRGHSLTIDSGWQEVAQVSLDFVRRFV